VDLNKELQQSGLKVTHPRVMVLRLLKELKDRHVSVEDVFKMLLDQDEDIGLATIYRVLGQFEDAGIVDRLNFDGGKAVYELNDTEHHDHLVCRKCGRVVEFVDELIEKKQHEVAHKHGITLTHHSLHLYGECLPQCESTE
jgi:Fur family ferric uptake transcriptional regulator